MEKSEIIALIESMGLTYTAEFVPLRNSRNSGQKHYSLNWVVSLSKGVAQIRTDYMQGIAHLPAYVQSLSNNAAYNTYLKTCAEHGKYEKGITAKNFHNAGYRFSLKIPAPELIDVMYSIMLDSDALDAGCFEDWADNFGMDTDSISAKKMYDSCIDTALRLRAMIGQDNINKLREALQDY